jgi:hypothetical protein
MKPTRLITTAIAIAVIAAPGAAQAAGDEPTGSASRLSGLPPLSQLHNVKAKKATTKRRAARPRARSAWAYGLSGGGPGAVTEAWQIRLEDFRQSIWMGGSYSYTWQLRISNPFGPTVTRSPATSGAQDANVIYSVQVWEGTQWVERLRVVRNGRIPEGYNAVRTPSFDAYPTVAVRGYVRVVMGINWFVAGTNTRLGYTNIVPDTASDHQCATSVRPCEVYNGFARLGSSFGGW